MIRWKGGGGKGGQPSQNAFTLKKEGEKQPGEKKKKEGVVAETSGEKSKKKRLPEWPRGRRKGNCPRRIDPKRPKTGRGRSQNDSSTTGKQKKVESCTSG